VNAYLENNYDSKNVDAEYDSMKKKQKEEEESSESNCNIKMKRSIK
jgi:hypothetical protein